MTENSNNDEKELDNGEEKLEKSSIIKFSLAMIVMAFAMIFAYYDVGPSGQRSSLIDIFILFLPQSILFVGFVILFLCLGGVKIVKIFKR